MGYIVRNDNPVLAVVSDVLENQDLVTNVNADLKVVTEVSKNQDEH